jgi:O-antigen/teichoic acid export membrane protein
MIRRLPNIVSDDLFKRIGKNLAYLFSADVVVVPFGLLTLAIMAWSLGPVGLGTIALIEGYVRAVDLLVRLQPWQALIRYGAVALENDRRLNFSTLVKFSYLTELLGGCIAAAVAIAGCSFAADWLQFSSEQVDLAQWYAATLVLSVSPTSTAILRFFNRFDLVAKSTVGLAIVRLLLATLAWMLEAGVTGFLFVLIVSQVLEPVVLTFFAQRQLHGKGFSGVHRAPLAGLTEHNPGILRFMKNTTLNVAARMATQRFDILIVGSLLGPGPVGLYQLAKRIGLAALRIGRPLQQVIYPDIARLWARGEVARFRRIVLTVNATIGIVASLVLLAAGFQMERIVELVFGGEFVAASPLMIAQILAVGIFLAGTTFGPALLSMGEDRALLRVTLASTVTFFAAMFPLVNYLGELGGSLSHVLFNGVWFTGCLAVFLRRTAVKETTAVLQQNADKI